jgi:hypothetical protein
VIFVQPYGGVVLGRGVGVEPLIADLHDGSVADSAAFVHANSIRRYRVVPLGRAVGPGSPGTGTYASRGISRENVMQCGHGSPDAFHSGRAGST